MSGEKKLSRRALLRSGALAGGALAMFPWLSDVRADTTSRRKLVLVYMPHGTVYDQWLPSGGETDFTLSPILSPLAGRRDDVVIVDGLHIVDPYGYRVPHTHDMPMVWTGSGLDESSNLFFRMHGENPVNFGWGLGKSIDQEIADRLAVDTPLRSLELGVRCGGAHPKSRMIYRAPGPALNPIQTAPQTFDQVFGGFTGPDVDVDELRQRSVLDAVHQDLTGLAQGLGASDRIRLENHADAIREIEQSLGGTLACELPTRPDSGGLDDVTIDRQLDMMVAALACGRTRIASFQLAQADNDAAVYPWVVDLPGGHHLTSHENTPAALSALSALYTWYTERFVYLLDRMAATPDGDGTSLLDNSVVILGSEIGRGDHNLANVPFLVAGGGCGTISGGRFIRTSGPHNRLLVSAFHAMGITDVDAWGLNDDGSGPITGLVG